MERLTDEEVIDLANKAQAIIVSQCTRSDDIFKVIGTMFNNMSFIYIGLHPQEKVEVNLGKLLDDMKRGIFTHADDIRKTGLPLELMNNNSTIN